MSLRGCCGFYLPMLLQFGVLNVTLLHYINELCTSRAHAFVQVSVNGKENKLSFLALVLFPLLYLYVVFTFYIMPSYGQSLV